jgi:putative SOS response-associated peptidase YedK
MCGKFTQYASWAEVHAFSQALTDDEGGGGAGDDDPLVIATPMRFASILRLDAAGEREMVQMRWGFADRKAANPARPKHMHASAETIDERPTFADAFAHARGILFVHTFNEGEEVGSKTKQWVITPRDGRPIAIAVIWEAWENAGETLLTFIQVTTPANALISKITDRMPAILRPEHHALWLGETGAPLSDVKAVLGTFEDCGAWVMEPQAPPVRPLKRPKATGGLL